MAIKGRKITLEGGSGKKVKRERERERERESYTKSCTIP